MNIREKLEHAKKYGYPVTVGIGGFENSCTGIIKEVTADFYNIGLLSDGRVYQHRYYPNSTLEIMTVEGQKPDEIIPGLSPGEWTCELNTVDFQIGYPWRVKDCKDDPIFLASNESHAKLMAGSKAFLESVIDYFVPDSLIDSTWEWKLKWIAENILGYESRDIFQAMKNCGVIFSVDDNLEGE